MAPTVDQIARLRRMIAEPTTTTYSDATLTAYLERYKLMDSLGHPPTILSTTLPLTEQANPEWVETYDLNAAAAELWGEKASVLSQDFNFSVDGGNFSRSDAYDHAVKQQRIYAARRSIRVISPQPVPRRKDNYEDLDSE